MTPDEIICTTCEDEGAVVWHSACQAEDIHDWPSDMRMSPHTDDAVWEAEEDQAYTDEVYGVVLRWTVDTCPECGRGREVGRL